MEPQLPTQKWVKETLFSVPSILELVCCFWCSINLIYTGKTIIKTCHFFVLSFCIPFTFSYLFLVPCNVKGTWFVTWRLKFCLSWTFHLQYILSCILLFSLWELHHFQLSFSFTSLSVNVSLSHWGRIPLSSYQGHCGVGVSRVILLVMSLFMFHRPHAVLGMSVWQSFS